MRRVMRYTVLLVLAGALAFFSPAAKAESLPSFSLERSAWNATHIVEVTQGEKCDGICTVLASWQGNLKKGNVLTFPELQAFAAEEHVNGLHMVLFLTKNGKGWAHLGGPISGISVAWFDQGQVSAYQQRKNPGPQVVCPLGMSEKQFKDRVLQITAAKEKLQQAVEIADPAKRAQGLSVLVGSDLYQCQHEAVGALGQCGYKGLPVVKKLIKENPAGAISQELIRATGIIAGVNADPRFRGKELAGLLKDEFAFWQKRGPQLKANWRQDERLGEKEVGLLRDRLDKFNAIIGALSEATYNLESGPLVREVRDFLKANPQLITEGVDVMDWCRSILAEK